MIESPIAIATRVSAGGLVASDCEPRCLLTIVVRCDAMPRLAVSKVHGHGEIIMGGDGKVDGIGDHDCTGRYGNECVSVRESRCLEGIGLDRRLTLAYTRCVRLCEGHSHGRDIEDGVAELVIDSVPDRVGSQADVQGLTNGRVVESTIDG